MPNTKNTMTKEENIFNLYDKLNKNGSKGQAIAFISEVTGIKRSSIKANWFLYRELPDSLKQNDSSMDKIIQYLQNALFQQNQDIKKIEVNT